MVVVTSYQREQRIAEQAVLQAAILTKRLQTTVSQIVKDDNSPVTVADFAAQAIIIGILHNAFPEDSFVGEETSTQLRVDNTLCKRVHDLVVATTSACDFPTTFSVDDMLRCIDLGGHGQGGARGRFWVMDPVDGTAAFLRGQQYAVSLSLIRDGKQVVGVLGCPNISAEQLGSVSETSADRHGFGIMLSAVLGRGATLQTMTLSGLENLEPLTSLKADHPKGPRIVGSSACEVSRHDVLTKLARHFGVDYPSTELWSSHIRYASLILGDGDAHFWIPSGPTSRMHIWDHAGTELIFTELGGKITDLDGKEIDFGAGRDLSRNNGLVVAKADMHPLLLELTRKML